MKTLKICVFVGLVVIGIIVGIILSTKKVDEKKVVKDNKVEEKKGAEPEQKAEETVVIQFTRTDLAENDLNKNNTIKEYSSYFLEANNGNPPVKGCWSVLNINTLLPKAGIKCDNSTIKLKLPYNVKATPLLADKNGNFTCSKNLTYTRPDIQAGGDATFGTGICGFKFTKTNDSPRVIEP